MSILTFFHHLISWSMLTCLVCCVSSQNTSVLPQMTSAPVIGEPYISDWKEITLGGRRFNATQFSVDCIISYLKQDRDDGARFDVVFAMDQTVVHEVTVNSTDPVTTIDESYLVGHIGKTLTCKVRTYFIQDNQYKSPFVISRGFWLGISPVSEQGSRFSSITLREGEEFSFRLTPTFPITLAHCMKDPRRCTFAHSFRIQSRANVRMSRPCAFFFFFSPARQVSTIFKISPIANVGLSRIVGVISFIKDQSLTIFRGYTIRSIPVIIHKGPAQPLCQLNSNHTMAFSGLHYDFGMIGDMNFLSSTDRIFQIQVRRKRCVQGICNCGVFVREGNAMMGVSYCDVTATNPKPELVNYLLDLVTPTGTIEHIDSRFEISLVSGIKIIAVLLDRSFTNTTVFGSRMESYGGICAQHNATTTETFRIHPEQSFFRFSTTNPPTCLNETIEIPRCNCLTDMEDSGERYLKITLDQIPHRGIQFVTRNVCV